ncbi:MAG: hypothetical protein ACI9R3_003455 [Verrucomicrobiales bacterium]|jgi:hypothetical protein
MRFCAPRLIHAEGLDSPPLMDEREVEKCRNTRGRNGAVFLE